MPRGDVVKVRDLMRQALVTIAPDAPVHAAVELMKSRQVRHLLVTEDGERLIGILTDRDLRHAAFLPLLARHFAWEERWLRTPRVRDIMTWNVVTIEPDADVTRASLVMFKRRIGSLPVSDGGRIVGILTERDILDALGDLGVDRPPAELYLG